MRVLDLFSGIGGFSLGLERAGMETVAFCEFDKNAQLVLKKHWPDVPIFNDVRKLNGKQFEGQSIQIICGGFPCQPFSQAGKRQGDQDDRHLWPEYFRIIQEIRPRWVIGENVAGLINLGLDQVLSDLEGADYSCQTLIIPACAVNAPHRRDRVWIIGRKRDVADSEGIGLQGGGLAGDSNGRGGKDGWPDQSTRASPVDGTRDVADSGSLRGQERHFERTEQDREEKTGDVVPCGETLADSECEGLQGHRQKHKLRKTGEEIKVGGCSNDVAHTTGIRQQRPGQSIESLYSEAIENGETTEPVNGCIGNHWAVEPELGRVAHGIPNRVDRLKQLGNAVVPQVVEEIGRAIMKADHEKVPERILCHQ